MFGPICFSIEKEQISSLPLTDQTKLVCFPGCIRQLVWGCHSNLLGSLLERVMCNKSSLHCGEASVHFRHRHFDVSDSTFSERRILACIEQSAQRHSRHDAKPAKHFGFVVCVCVSRTIHVHTCVCILASLAGSQNRKTSHI